MRIVVSGTHGSGKSTLISDFALRHPEFTVLPDPFDLLDEAAAGPRSFAAQLRIAADRLTDDPSRDRLIAERGPLDFVAYLLAAAELEGTSVDDDILRRGIKRTAAALRTVDALVVLPLTTSDPIHVGTDEDLELREAMDATLLELIDDPEIVDERLTVLELTGAPARRLAGLEHLVEPVTTDRAPVPPSGTPR